MKNGLSKRLNRWCMGLRTLAMTGVGILLMAARSPGDPLIVAGSPTYDWTTGTGYGNGGAYGVNNRGVAVGGSTKYVSGIDKGIRAVRWDISGAASELPHLGTATSGWTQSFALAINDAGTIAGFAEFRSTGSYLGKRALLWHADGTMTELGHLGTNSSGYTDAFAMAMNTAGTIVGYSNKYASGDVGRRAIRWNAGSTVATELGHLGTNSTGWSDCQATAVNNPGTAIGFCHKYESGVWVGSRAVRWDAGSIVATELGNLGLSSSGPTRTHAEAINDAGTIVGYCEKYSGGLWLGVRAVRWEASGTVTTELQTLGTHSSGLTYASARAVNNNGTAVGSSTLILPEQEDEDFGTRAVRWDAGGTAATELENLGTDSFGYTDAEAVAVNIAGSAVGYCLKYFSDSDMQENRAVIWLPDARVIDLNDLGVAPVAGGGSWVLNFATSMSADGWVAGSGTFTPAGGSPYVRHWVTQVGLGGDWTAEFTGSLDGTWGRGPQWSTGTPAMQVGDAVFNADATYTVTLDRDERTQSVSITAGTVTIDFAGHTLEAISGLSINSSATLKGSGTIIGNVTNSGTIAPGSSTGILDIEGNLTDTGGALVFEINGLVVGAEYDQLNVSGTADLGGTLVIVLGFTPSAGDRFQIMSFGSLVNRGFGFDFEPAALGPGLRWDTSTFETTGEISVIPESSTLILLPAGLATLFSRRRNGLKL